MIHYRQRGLSLLTALFVITVMAVLAVIILQLVRNNAETTEEAILLNRAFNTAESGIQVGLNKVFPPAGGGVCPFTQTFNFSEDGLNACSAEVTCSLVNVASENFVTLKSKGTCDGVSRTVQVRAQ